MKNNNHTVCPLCGETVKKTKIKYSFDMLECEKCSHMFAADIPSEEELKSYYSNYCYDNYSSIIEITKKRYREILKNLSKYKQTNNLLEIGCGTGDFLEIAREDGWNIYGSEYSQKAVEILKSKNINCFDDDIHTFQSEIKYDAIVCIEVIEHVNNPKENIKKYYDLLREGGVLYLTTPNSKSMTAKFLKSSWRIFSYPEHLSYFTPKSLKALLISCGFQIVSQKTTGISIGLIRENFSKKTSSINPDSKLRSNIESNKKLSFLKTIANFLLSTFKIGDTHKIYAKK